MIISFTNKKLAAICNSEKEARAKLGMRLAERLMQRMTELRAADTLADVSRLPPPRCHELTNNRQGQLAVVLMDRHRLVFSPDHDPLPQREVGGLDWEQVTQISVEEIVDYHT